MIAEPVGVGVGVVVMAEAVTIWVVVSELPPLAVTVSVTV